MSALAKKVAVGFTASVIATVLGVFFKEPLADAIVGVIRELPDLLAPVSEWVVAHHVLAALVSAAVGAVGARVFVQAIGLFDAKGFAAVAGGILSGAAASSIAGWLEGSVANGPVALGLVAVMATVLVIGSLRSAAHYKRMREPVGRPREIAGMDPHLRFLSSHQPPVPMQRVAQRPRDAARADALQATARFLSMLPTRHTESAPAESTVPQSRPVRLS